MSRRNNSHELAATDASTPCRASRGLCPVCRAAATEGRRTLFCKAAPFLLRVRRAPPPGACSGPVLASYLVGHIFLYCLRPSFYARASAELRDQERGIEQLQRRERRRRRYARLAALRRRRRAPRAPGRAARRRSRETLRREGAHVAPLTPPLVAAHDARRRAARRRRRRRRRRHTPRAQHAARARVFSRAFPRVFRRRARPAIRRADALRRRRARRDDSARRHSSGTTYGAHAPRRPR